jgi:hypothetical protein
MRAAPRSEWLAYVLGGLPGALLALLAATGIVSERAAMALFAPSFVGLNLAHMASAWGHAYLDAPGWRGARVERVVVPAALVLGALGVDAVGGGALLLAAQSWLSLHHAAMQNYGLLRATQRRRGRVLAASALRVDQAACLLPTLGALAHRARAVCSVYDGAALPAPPAALEVVLLGAGVVALAAFVAREATAAARGEPVDPLGVALVLSTSLLWPALLMGLRHPALPLYAIASGHYIQQIFFVWRRPATRAWFGARWSRWTAPPARLGYLAGLAAVGAAVVLLLTSATAVARALADAAGVRPAAPTAAPTWLAAMIGVNLWHYWIEGRIWRGPSAR